jgi:hypothetical protein
VLGVAHLLIDTRRPLHWWAAVMSQSAGGPLAGPIHIWRDQTLHIAALAVAALIVV